MNGIDYGGQVVLGFIFILLVVALFVGVLLL